MPEGRVFCEGGEMIIARVYIPSIEQSTAINCTKDIRRTRIDMAYAYADCIMADLIARADYKEGVDFKIVNKAILKRWPGGLRYIKRKAWKIVDGIK